MTTKLIDAAVMSVPGLSFLVGALVLPGALLRGLASAVLAVAASAVIGYVLIRRPSILAWRRRVAGRRVVLAAVAAVVLLIGYALAYGTVVAAYEWPPGSLQTAELLVPAEIAEGEVGFPYIDCTRAVEEPCLPEAEGSRRAVAASADDVARRMATLGPGAYHIPRGGSWYVWVAALVGLHAATGGLLVFLFGLLRVRGVDVLSFLSTGAPKPPAPAAPPAGAPVPPVEEGARPGA